jgi:hypothetical protein
MAYTSKYAQERLAKYGGSPGTTEGDPKKKKKEKMKDLPKNKDGYSVGTTTNTRSSGPIKTTVTKTYSPDEKETFTKTKEKSSMGKTYKKKVKSFYKNKKKATSKVAPKASVSFGTLINEGTQEFASDYKPKKKLMKRMWKKSGSSKSKPYK